MFCKGWVELTAVWSRELAAWSRDLPVAQTISCSIGCITVQVRSGQFNSRWYHCTPESPNGTMRLTVTWYWPSTNQLDCYTLGVFGVATWNWPSTNQRDCYKLGVFGVAGTSGAMLLTWYWPSTNQCDCHRLLTWYWPNSITVAGQLRDADQSAWLLQATYVILTSQHDLQATYVMLTNRRHCYRSLTWCWPISMTVTGDLRDTNQWTWLLQATFLILTNKRDCYRTVSWY